MGESNALTKVEPAGGGMVEWSLDNFPEREFNRLVPTQTLQLPTDLLRPVVQVVRLNPDPKTGGDVYTSNDTPSGHAAPTKVGLRKLATAAGISFVDERRTDDGSNPDVCEVTCVAEMLLPTGQRIRAVGTKRVDMSAQSWASPAQKAKYRSFFQEHVASRAQNRAIRSLLSLRGSYPLEVYSRPFAVVSFAPNMDHPEVRSRILDAMTGTAAALYGPAPAAQLAPGPINVTPATDDDEAPAPRQLPGESLARAQQPAQAASADPDWFAAAEPEGPSFLQKLRDNAAASGLQGPATDPQKKRLQELFKPLGAERTAASFQLAFGIGLGQVTAAQAQAVLNLAESDADFEDHWLAMLGAQAA